jgi:hypothetical protein
MKFEKIINIINKNNIYTDIEIYKLFKLDNNMVDNMLYTCTYLNHGFEKNVYKSKNQKYTIKIQSMHNGRYHLYNTILNHYILQKYFNIHYLLFFKGIVLKDNDYKIILYQPYADKIYVL